MDWIWAFFFTQAVEIPIYMRALRVKPYEAFGASALTHPIVWFLIPPFSEYLYRIFLLPHPSLHLGAMPRYWLMVVIAETFAVVAEGFYFRSIGKDKAFQWSFVANMASVLLGFASRAVFGWP